jgi:inhibitor of cysteine peptidase
MSACSSTGTSTGGGSTAVHVTAADQGKTVPAKVGDRLVVTLEGNPSTGYTWIAQDLPPFLAQQGDAVFSKGSNSGAVGAPGTLALTFKATTTGSGDLVLDYKRPWETTATPAQTFSATVHVQ